MSINFILFYSLLWFLAIFNLILISALFKILIDIKESVANGNHNTALQPMIGELAPLGAAKVFTDTGLEVELPSPQRSGGYLLLFIGSTCGTCANLLAEISRDKSSTLKDGIIIVCHGTKMSSQRLLSNFIIEPLSYSTGNEATLVSKFNIPFFPAAFAIDQNGYVKNAFFPDSSQDLIKEFTRGVGQIDD